MYASRKEEGRELTGIQDSVNKDWRLHFKKKLKTDYNDQKQFRQHTEENNQKTKIGRKTTDSSSDKKRNLK